jgi:putative alpha-1,2-mannosidase
MKEPLNPSSKCPVHGGAVGRSAFTRGTCVALLFALAVCNARPQSSHESGPAASVNPLIGTGSDPDDGINLFPGATTPFGMVQLSPDTEDHGFGYHYIHTRIIKGFSMTHMSGPGCANRRRTCFSRRPQGPIVTQDCGF